MMSSAGSRASPVCTSSRALSANFSVESNTPACELSMIYFSSPTGKAGDSGTAIALQARMDRSVTTQSQSAMLYTYTGSDEYSTYVVIAILREERNSLPRHGAPAGGTGELLLCLQHVGD
jgi:hypothetical protein